MTCCCKISETTVDLLFRGVLFKRKESFNLYGNLLDGFFEAEVKSRYH